MTEQRIIRTYLSIAAVTTLAQSLIWGINTLFLLSAGMNIFGVMIVNAAFTVAQALFEVPTGVMADTIGRRISYLLSIGIIFLSTLMYLWFGLIHVGVPLFSVASALLGVGFCFYTGAVDAWLVDALASVDYKGTLDVVFARYGMVFGAMMLVGTVGGGLLGQAALWIPYLGRAALLVPAFVLGFMGMHDLGFTSRPLNIHTVNAEARLVARNGIRYGLGDPVVRLLMGCTFIIGIFAMYGFYSWQAYFLDLLGRNLVWVSGLIAALIGLCQIAGSMLVGPLMKRNASRAAIVITAVLVMTLGILVAAVTSSFWVAVPFYLVATLALGTMTPVKQSWINSRIPSAQRATLLSMDALFGEAGGTVGQLGLGYVSAAISIPVAWMIGGSLQILAAPLALRAHQKQQGETTEQPAAAAR